MKRTEGERNEKRERIMGTGEGREGIIEKRDGRAIGRLQMRIAFTFLCGSIPSRRPAAHSSKWGAVSTTGTFWFGLVLFYSMLYFVLIRSSHIRDELGTCIHTVRPELSSFLPNTEVDLARPPGHLLARSPAHLPAHRPAHREGKSERESER